MRPAAIVSLAPARYSATVSGLAPGCHAAREIAVDCSGSANASSIAIPISSPGSIRGQIRDASAGTTVGLLPEDGAAPVVIAIPDADSRFSFAALQPGRYRVWAQAPADSRPKAIEVEVRGGTTVEVALSATTPKAP